MKFRTAGSPAVDAARAVALLAAGLAVVLVSGCSGQVNSVGGPPGAGPPGMGNGPGNPGGGPGNTPPGMGGMMPPGGGGNPSAGGPTCNPAQKSFAPARVWQLTDKQYVNVVRDVFGIMLSDEDGKIVSAGVADRYTNYSELMSIDTQVAPNYQTVALRVADLAEARMAALVGAPAPDAGNMRAFITTKIARAWRRPLVPAEVDGLLKIFTEGLPDGAARAFHLVLEAALQAPSFLYRTELGTNAATAQGPIQLTGYELASALSFLFLETSPDDALWAKAASGALDDPAQLAAEVDRLMKLPAAKANMTARASYWLGLGGIANRSRTKTLYPEWDEALKNNLTQSIQLFLGDVISAGKLSDLFTSNKVYLTPGLARTYGIPTTGTMSGMLLPIAVEGPQRSAGILTQPGLLVAANKSIDRADVVHRGLMINDAFICGGTVPPAPPEAADEAKKMDGTERERANARAAKPTCAGCHRKFDPPGLTFERYDALGRYSETRQAVLDSMTNTTSWQPSATPVDASAELIDDGLGGNLGGRVNGVNELAAKLAAAQERVGFCASRRLAEYALGYNPDAENSCELKAVKEVLVKTGSFQDFFRALVLSPGFRTRNPVPPPI